MSRRVFVKASSAALAGLSLGEAAAQDPARTYRACVIGHTGRGGYGHGLDLAFQVVLYGSKGVAQIHIGADPRVYPLADPLWSPGRSGAAWQPLPGAPAASDPSVPDPMAAGNKRLVEDLIRAVENGGPSAAGVHEGRATLEMVMAVYASHLEGRRVALPLKERKHPPGSLTP